MVAIVLSVVMATYLFLLAEERVNTRDAFRLRDMRVIEQTFRKTFLATGSYRSATLPADVSDPSKFSYTVVGDPTETSFAVRFFLERSHDGLQAGEHVLTENGIQ